MAALEVAEKSTEAKAIIATTKLTILFLSQ